MDLKDRFETIDGSAPEPTPLSEAIGKTHPLPAFALLEGGDVFEALGGKPPREGATVALRWVESHVELLPHGASAAHRTRVRNDLVRQLSGNPALTGRLLAARPLSVDLVPAGRSMAAYGYPKAVSARASGLFWDHPSWPRARIALRQDRLDEEAALVIHEAAHAIGALAFTGAERKALHRVLLPTYRTRAAAEEVFAIYSEREFVAGFEAKDFAAPGVYGRTRTRWSEEHLLTRFVRHLYFPHKPLAGPKGP